jgi:hypothetical protein
LFVVFYDPDQSKNKKYKRKAREKAELIGEKEKVQVVIKIKRDSGKME